MYTDFYEQRGVALGEGEPDSTWFGSEDEVAATLVRPLTQQEKSVLDLLLERAFRMIVRETGPLSKKSEPGYWEIVSDVVCEMVARKLRNPDGKTQEADGQYSYGMMAGVASGKVELTDADRELLGLNSGGLFMVHMNYGRSS